MKKKLISLLTVSAMMAAFAIPAYAENEGPAPENAIGVGSTNVNAPDTNGVIDYVWNMPATEKEITNVTVTVYNDNTTTQAATPVTKTGITSEQKNVTASFENLTIGNKYDAEIVINYSDNTTGVSMVEDVKVEKTMGASPRREYNGIYMRNWMVQAYDNAKKGYRTIYDISYDTENYKTGTGSAKIDFRGYLNVADGTVSTGAKGHVYFHFKGMSHVPTAGIYALEVIQKGKNSEFLQDHTSSKQLADAEDSYRIWEDLGDGWWKMTRVIEIASAKNIWYGLGFEYSNAGTIYLDSIALRPCTYDADTKTFTIPAGSENVLGNTNFTNDVVNPTIDKTGLVEWSEVEPQYLNKIYIYEGDTLRGEVNPQICEWQGVAGTQYTIKTRTQVSAEKVSSKLTPGVAVTEKKTIQVENGNWTSAAPVNAMAVGTDWGDRQGNVADTTNNDGIIDVIWNMPTADGKTVDRVDVKLYEAGTTTVVSEKEISAAAGVKNQVASFKDLLNTNFYDVEIAIVYTDATGGKTVIKNVQADSHQNFDGIYVGSWGIWSGPTKEYRELVSLDYDTENYKTGNGSLRLEYRGNVTVADDTFKAVYPPVGNAYAKMVTSVSVTKDKYYLAEITYKTDISNQKDGVKWLLGADNTGSDAWAQDVAGAVSGQKYIETTENGWTTKKYVIKAGGTQYWTGVHVESLPGTVWIDGYTLKECTYNVDDKTYEVIGEDLINNGGILLEVEDATIEKVEDGGIITFTHPYPDNVAEYVLCDSEGNPIEGQTTTGTSFVVTDAEAKYIIKVKTKHGNKIATALTNGVEVKEKVEIVVPDDAWTSPAAGNIMAVGTDWGDRQGNVADSNMYDGIIDITWDMPEASGREVDSVKIKLYENGTSTLVKQTVSKAQLGSKNNVATFKELNNEALYDAEIAIVYTDATGGKIKIDGIQADSQQDIDGMYIGDWDLWSGPSENHRELISLDYDTENYKTGSGSLKLTYKGNVAVADNSFVPVYPPVGNAFTQVVTSAEVTKGKTYLAEITYKTDINNTDVLVWMAGKSPNGSKDWVLDIAGAAEGKNYSETVDGEWTTRRYVVEAKDGTEANPEVSEYWAGILLESLPGTVWIDSYTLKECTYNNSDCTYEVVGEDLINNGGISIEAENAVVEHGEGYDLVTFTHPYPDNVAEYVLCDGEGTPIEGMTTTNEMMMFLVTDIKSEYILKVRTADGSKAATTLSEGTAVTLKSTEPEQPEPIETKLTLTREENSAVANFITANDGTTPSAVLILAEYLNGKLLGIITNSDASVTSNGVTLEIANNTLTTGSVIKAMVFDSLSTMKPLLPSVSK